MNALLTFPTGRIFLQRIMAGQTQGEINLYISVLPRGCIFLMRYRTINRLITPEESNLENVLLLNEMQVYMNEM